MTRYQTQFHRDGTVTVWDVYSQRWLRTRNPSVQLLASLGSEERERIIKHCEKEGGDGNSMAGN